MLVCACQVHLKNYIKGEKWKHFISMAYFDLRLEDKARKMKVKDQPNVMLIINGSVSQSNSTRQLADANCMSVRHLC